MMCTALVKEKVLKKACLFSLCVCVCVVSNYIQVATKCVDKLSILLHLLSLFREDPCVSIPVLRL